jgi:hypothetical protein
MNTVPTSSGSGSATLLKTVSKISFCRDSRPSHWVRYSKESDLSVIRRGLCALDHFPVSGIVNDMLIGCALKLVASLNVLCWAFLD